MCDAPGLEVRYGSLDDVADFVDGGVELLFPVEEFAVGGFLDWGDHPASLVSFVACPVGGVEGIEDAGGVEAVDVVMAPGDGIGDPGQGSVRGGGDLDVEAGGLVFAAVQVGLIVP